MHAHRMEACRIVITTPSSHGGIGDLYNFKMAPSLTLGCGTWGGNIVSENIALKHYMNTTWVARPLAEDMPSNEELFGEFFKEGMDQE